MTPYVYTTTSNNNHNHNLNEVPPESHVARYPIFALQREFNNLVIQTCSKLHLSDEIEFFCIDVFETYMENLFNNVNMLVVKRLEKHPITQNDSDTQLLELKMFIDECLQKVEKEFLLGIFSLVSVKSKYSDSSGWALQYRFMQSMLQKTNAPCTFKHMRCAEFEAFKNIGFNVSKLGMFKNKYYMTLPGLQIKRSTTLKVLGSLIKICAKEVNWSDSVAEYIYEVAVKILRLVCVERERVYGR